MEERKGKKEKNIVYGSSKIKELLSGLELLVQVSYSATIGGSPRLFTRIGSSGHMARDSLWLIVAHQSVIGELSRNLYYLRIQHCTGTCAIIIQRFTP